MTSAEDFRTLERTRLRALVERDMELARSLHSPEFHLVTPGGVARSRESYLTAVETGALTYLKWQAAEIAVRQFSDVVLLRYQAALEMPSQSGGTSSFVCWHTDAYELHNGLWQVVLLKQHASSSPRRTARVAWQSPEPTGAMPNRLVHPPLV